MSIIPKTSEITWPDGTTFATPIIAESENGWVYKPPSIATRTDKSFGRGWEGQREARQWATQRLERFVRNKAYKTPSVVKVDRISNSTYQNQLVVHWHSTWGTFRFSIMIRPPDYRQSQFDVLFEEVAPSIAIGIIERKLNPGGVSGGYLVPELSPYVDYVRTQTRVKYDKDPADIRKVMTDWAANPVTTTLRELRTIRSLDPATSNAIRFARFLADNINFPTAMFELNYDSDSQEIDTPMGQIWLGSGGNVHLYRSGAAEQIVQVNMERLGELLDAFRFLGIQVYIGQSYMGDEQVVDRVTFSIPADEDSEDPYRELGHSVDITPNGVSVTCGFVKDEKRYLERQARLAQKFLTEITEEFEDMEFSIEERNE